MDTIAILALIIIPLGILFRHLYLKQKYQYIVTNVYLTTEKSILIDTNARFNKFIKQYEVFSPFTLKNKYVDLKEYDNLIFLNSDIAEKYIKFKETLKKQKEPATFQVSPYSKFNRIATNLRNQNILFKIKRFV